MGAALYLLVRIRANVRQVHHQTLEGRSLEDHQEHLRQKPIPGRWQHLTAGWLIKRDQA